MRTILNKNQQADFLYNNWSLEVLTFKETISYPGAMVAATI